MFLFIELFSHIQYIIFFAIFQLVACIVHKKLKYLWGKQNFLKDILEIHRGVFLRVLLLLSIALNNQFWVHIWLHTHAKKEETVARFPLDFA